MNNPQKDPYVSGPEPDVANGRIHQLKVVRGVHLSLYWILTQSDNKWYWVIDLNTDIEDHASYAQAAGISDDDSVSITTAHRRGLVFGQYQSAAETLYRLNGEIDRKVSDQLKARKLLNEEIVFSVARHLDEPYQKGRQIEEEHLDAQYYLEKEMEEKKKKWQEECDKKKQGGAS